MNVAYLPTVLIVDDDRMNRTALAELLQPECRVILAKDGASALSLISQEPEIGLILLDIAMPTMDGYEMLRCLRSTRETADTPVIFITARTEEVDEEYGLQLGAVDYLRKPIRPAIARARIRNHLKMVAQRKELERLAERDGLTGIANRRHFDWAFDLACRNAARTREPLGLAMIDVDHFKLYNDHYGHIAGDDILRQIAHAIASVTRRPTDLAARYGGEEFVLLLPGVTDLAGMLIRLRQGIQNLALPHAASPTAGLVTISCGGIAAAGLDRYDPSDLLRQADALLYLAKQQGRDRFVVAAHRPSGSDQPVVMGADVVG